jgi:cyclic-di-AMP phosphodiesterase PgpH
MWFSKKTSARRSLVRKTMSAERHSYFEKLLNADIIISFILWLLFIVLCVPIFSFERIQEGRFSEILPLTIIVLLISTVSALYIQHYQKRLMVNHTRVAALVGLFIILLAVTKIGVLLGHHAAWATGTAVGTAMILSITYNQRFAMGLSAFYCLFASFAAGEMGSMNLFIIMAAGALTCCFCLREIRTRMKLLEVSAVTVAIVMITAASLDFLQGGMTTSQVFKDAGNHGLAAFFVGILIQSLLPLIEKIFRITTSMTLLDYSDANQPLLKRLALEAPGTFSHSLLVGSIAEAAAQAIGRNGLLSRVGAYYHDIGKINKSTYFTENQMGEASRHKELSPAMSQLIIVGHVKDGVEIAKEYGLPAVLRQFVETHHGTTLVEYFYNQAKKRQDETHSMVSESEFRYTGPKPRTKEAAIVMLSDAIEGAVRSLADITPTRIEAVVHNMAMKRLQDGQFDECDLSLKELSQIEASISKTLAAHYHGRIAYPKVPNIPEDMQADEDPAEQ